MINKDEAEKKNIKIIDREDKKSEDRNDIIAKLKEILPNVITSDETLNIDALKDVIDIANTTANNKGYELTFAGKGLAKALADIPTDKALKIEEAQSKDFKNTDNVVIRGDNIEVLKLLKQNYYGKIKMIYIDPPYNTKNEDFLYKDNFNIRDEKELVEEFGIGEDTVNFLSNIYGTRSHSGWLSFMYPRLKLARDLLTDDGVIFISIDDHEQANLKIICDEIFGENNFVDNLKWKRKKQPSFLAKHTAGIIEYILVYAKTFDKLSKLSIEGTCDSTKKVINVSNPYSSKVFKAGTRVKLEGNGVIKAGKHTIRTMDIEYKNNLEYKNGKTLNEVEVIAKFAVTQENIDQFIDNQLLFITSNYGLRRDLAQDEIGKRKSITDLLLDWGDNQDSEIEITKLMGSSEIFNFTKPTKLIQNTIKSILYNEDDIILDFFAGSGTTGDAVMQLNAEDGGSRKFILAQWDEKDEKIDENKSKTAYDFCIENKLEPVISSITIERLNRAGEKITTDKPELKDTLDIGYKVFSLADKRKFDDNEYGKLVLETYNFSTFDKLYQMMNSSNKPLHLKIEEIEKDKLYKVDNEFYILDTFKTSIEDLQGHQIYLDAYSTISLEDALNLGIIDNENLTIIY